MGNDQIKPDSRPQGTPQNRTNVEEKEEKLITTPGHDLYTEALGHLTKENFAQAKDLFEKAAQLGHPVARVNLATMFLAGQGCERSVETALEILNVGAGVQGGEVECFLGHLYLRGFFVDEDLEKSISYFKKAISLENKDAQAHLGFMYVEGNGVEKDEKLGLKMIEEVISGSPIANNYLGFMYMEGIGVQPDYLKANDLFNTAIKNGYLGAGVNLSQMYFNGWGIAKNPPRAVRVIQHCADRGDSSAIAYLGIMYRDGFGVQKDSDKAFELLRRSAYSGNTLGLYAYGKFLLNYGPGEDTDWEVIADLFLRASASCNKLDSVEKFESFYIDGLYRIFAGIDISYQA